jgi:hypothetical protein
MRVYFLRFLSIKITNKKLRRKSLIHNFVGQDYREIHGWNYGRIFGRIVFITENKKLNITAFGTV